MSTYADIQDVIQKSLDHFISEIEISSRVAWSGAKMRIEQMPTYTDDQGVKRIANVEESQLKATEIAYKLYDTIFTSSFQKRVNDLARVPFHLDIETFTYYLRNFGTPSVESQREGRNIATRYSGEILQAMSSQSITENVFEPVMNALLMHLSNNSTPDSVITDLEQRILKRFDNYLRPIAGGLLQSSSSDINQNYSNSFELVWVRYDRRRTTEDTRDFCFDRESGVNGNPTHYHIDEVKQVWSRHEGGNWAGALPGTNANNIETNRGGYGCVHYFEYVEADQVSNKDKARALRLGYQI